MKLPVVLAALIGILGLACSTVTPVPAEPTPNIDATVEAKVAQELGVNATVEARANELVSDQPTPTPNVWMLEVRAEANLREEATDWFEKGVLLSRRGQYQDAIEAFGKAIEIGPRKYFYHERAVSYQALRQDRHAVQDLTKEITLFSREVRAVTYAKRAYSYRQLGYKYKNSNEYANARNDEAKACSLDSKYCASPTATPTPTPAPQPANTPTLVPAATPTFVLEPTPTLTPDPTPTPTPPPTRTPTPTPTPTAKACSLDSNSCRRQWFDEGVSLSKLGLYEDAISNFNKAIEIGPRNNFYAWRGSSYARLGQYENAIQDLTSEITHFNASGGNYRWRAYSKGELGDYVNAESDDAKACSLDSRYCWHVPLDVPIAYTPRVSSSFINLENLNEKVEEVPKIAWDDSQMILSENSGSSISAVELQIEAGPTTDLSLELTEAAFSTAMQFWAGFDHPSKFIALFYNSDDLSWVVNELIGYGWSKTSATERAQRACSTTSCSGASAGLGSGPYRSVGIAIFGVNHNKIRTPIHEYTHAIQMSPWKSLSSPGGGFERSSPCWLIEGSANLAGYSAGTTNYADYLDGRSQRVNSRHKKEPSSDYSTSKILEYYNNNNPWVCRDQSDYLWGYTVGFLTVEALSAIAGSNSSMYLYKYMSSGKTFEEAFEIIYGSSWEEAKPILASYVSSTINLVVLSIDRANS
jgi:tetratricopeptide (TPR) repeat protein